MIGKIFVEKVTWLWLYRCNQKNSKPIKTTEDMKNVINAMQNFIYGDFRLILSDNQLKNIKTRR